MKISKKSQYGLRAMIHLAKNKGTCSLKDISEAESISFDYLEKILLLLEKAGIIKGKRGRSGGYCLSRPPSKITVAEIVRALEGKIVLIECDGCLKTKNCLAKGAWGELQKSLLSTLESITLLKLIKK